MDTYRVVIPIKVSRLQRSDDKREEEPTEEQISLRVLAYSPEDAASRLTVALSHMITRPASGAE